MHETTRLCKYFLWQIITVSCQVIGPGYQSLGCSLSRSGCARCVVLEREHRQSSATYQAPKQWYVYCMCVVCFPHCDIATDVSRFIHVSGKLCISKAITKSRERKYVLHSACREILFWFIKYNQ